MNRNAFFSQALCASPAPSQGQVASAELLRRAALLLAFSWERTAQGLARAAESRRARIERRKARDQLRGIDPHLLRDLGLTRFDMQAASDLEEDTQA